MLKERLISLDVLRGITIIGMILVNAAATVHYGLDKQVYGLLLHAPWSGLTLADLVFPAFIFMVGMSIVFSLGPVKATGGLTGDVFKKISVRSFKIILIGVILSNLHYFSNFDDSFFRPFGVLQRIGIVFFFAAIIYLTCSERVLAIIAAVLLVGYIGFLYLPYPDGTVDLSVKGSNFVCWVDRWLAEGHTYVKGALGYDPEGIVSTLPTIGHALIGVLCADWLQKNKARPSLIVKRFLIIGAIFIVVGILASPLVPIAKEIWSPTFVLVTSGICMMLFAVLYHFLDVKKVTVPGTNFCLAFGVNSIFAYVVHYIVTGALTWSLSRLFVEKAVMLGLPEKAAALIPVILFIVAHWYFLNIMRRKNWIVKV